MQIEIEVIDNKKCFLTRPILKIPIQEIMFDVSLGEVIVVDNDAFLSSHLADMNLELDERQKRKTDYVVALLNDKEAWLMPKHPLTVKLIKKEKT